MDCTNETPASNHGREYAQSNRECVGLGPAGRRTVGNGDKIIMVARKSMSDKVRFDYRVYFEPVLARACDHMAATIGCRTLSKYVRYATINQLIRDGYPLGDVSCKFDKFIALNKGVTSYK